jgi:hypothetical protein
MGNLLPKLHTLLQNCASHPLTKDPRNSGRPGGFFIARQGYMRCMHTVHLVLAEFWEFLGSTKQDQARMGNPSTKTSIAALAETELNVPTKHLC